MKKVIPSEPDQVKQVVVRDATSAAYTGEQPRDAGHLPSCNTWSRSSDHRQNSHPSKRPTISSAMQDPEVLRTRAKVQLIGDEELEKLHSQTRGHTVEVTLKSTERNSGTERVVESVRGTPENPMSREEVVAKARDLIVPVLGAPKCDALIEKLLNLENLKNIHEIRPLLQRS